MPKKVLFIINPKAGVKKKMDVPAFIEEHFPSGIEKEIVTWNNPSSFEAIKNKIFEGGFTVAVAVGGDGTVNQVAAVLNNTNVTLGILPFGSGNGLARSIGISMDIPQALQQVAKGTAKKIDSGTINDIPFFCTSGTGFDAHIGHLFAGNTKRGFSTYAKIILKELFSYKPQRYKLTIDGKEINEKAFLLTFANAGQYGNDFYIAPEAKMDDGILQVVVVKPFNLLMAPFIVLKAFRRKAHTSSYITTFRGKEIKISRSEESVIHFDGEPATVKGNIYVKVAQQTLSVIS